MSELLRPITLFPFFSELVAGVWGGEQVTVIGWLVTEKVVSTKKGEPMNFVTFEDQTGLYDATLFPNPYRRYCHVLAMNQAYAITGLVEEQLLDGVIDGEGAATLDLSFDGAGM